ncbi:MAG: hypothetical protein ACYCY6_01775 [Minisyncoccota bacterium]
MKFTYILLLMLAVAAVAIADVFLKKASLGHTLSEAFKSPWMLGAIALYLFQIIFFTYVFVAGAQLTNVGILQTALYAIIVLVSGFLFFKETLTPIQVSGIVLALAGVVLINLK